MSDSFRRERISRSLQVTAQWHDDAWYTTAGALGTGTGRQPGAEIGIPRPLVGSALDSHGIEQFGITETTTESTDGSFTVTLTVAFVPPSSGAASAAGIPLLSLNAGNNSTGGTIAGGQTLYYAISALDGSGGRKRIVVHRPRDDPFGNEYKHGHTVRLELFFGDGRVQCVSRDKSGGASADCLCSRGSEFVYGYGRDSGVARSAG